MAWTTVFGPDPFTGTPFTALPTYDAAYTQDVTNGTWRISTNGTSAGSVAVSGPRVSLVSAPAADQAVEFTFQTSGSISALDAGLNFRFTDGDPGNYWGGTGYRVHYESAGVFRLSRLDGGGSHTSLTTGSATPVNNDVLRAEIIGSSIEIFLAGISIITFTDATYATGTVGMFSGSSLNEAVNFSVDLFTAQEQAAAIAGYLLVKN